MTALEKKKKYPTEDPGVLTIANLQKVVIEAVQATTGPTPGNL
jgi:hypothetical protein